MKRLQSILIIALALVSCGNKVEGPYADKSPIAFGELVTRATVDDISEFSVFANMSRGDGTASALLTNEKVYKEDEAWTYDNTQYWAYDCTYDFFAIYPYDSRYISEVQAVTFTIDDVSYEGYKLPFTISDAADLDLMAAYKQETTSMDPLYIPTNVSLEFDHILSKIDFKVAKNDLNEDNKIVLTRLSLSGVKNNGTFYATAVENKDYWDTSASSTIQLHPAVKSDGLSTVATAVLQNPLLVIPQEVEESSILLTIEYNFYNDAAGTSFAYKNSMSKYLPSTNKWESGSSYVYSLILDEEANDIVFSTPSIVGDWGEGVQTGGTLIIQ